MSSSLSAQKVASDFLKASGLVVDFHVPASITNIIYGHGKHDKHHESCLKDMRTYLRLESVKLEEDQLLELVNLTRAAL